MRCYTRLPVSSHDHFATSALGQCTSEANSNTLRVRYVANWRENGVVGGNAAVVNSAYVTITTFRYLFVIILKIFFGVTCCPLYSAMAL